LTSIDVADVNNKARSVTIIVGCTNSCQYDIAGTATNVDAAAAAFDWIDEMTDW
jgi:hypothetical protein